MLVADEKETSKCDCDIINVCLWQYQLAEIMINYDKYFVKRFYYSNNKYRFFDDRAMTDEFQDDVYFFASEFAKAHQFSRILDIGCGVGRLSSFFSQIGYQDITAVDFPEMITRAKEENYSSKIIYIPSSAQDFLSDNKFNLIISSGCFGAIRKRDFFYKTLDNCIKMQNSGDFLLMVDPFHKNNFLARGRARISVKDIIKYMQLMGYSLEEKSGMLCIPIQLLIAHKWKMSESTTKRLFYLGELFLNLFSMYSLADYKILSFKKNGALS